MKLKKLTALLLAGSLMFSLAACGNKADAPASNPPAENSAPASTPVDNKTPDPDPADDANLTETQKIIKEAEGMTLEELAKKAIEESNGKMFYGVGNSSRGKSALPLFIEY